MCFILKMKKFFKKCLQFDLTYGIIFRHAVKVWRKKHALMREVAHPEWGNFRGVCPILNRAKELGLHKETCDFVYNGIAICRPELTATPASTGFIMCLKEKHGTL